MKRREFLEWGIPATGAFMLAPGLFGNTARGAGRPAEMDRQFAGNPGFDIYDVLVNGGGLGGYFAALHAARSGKKVLLVEKRAGLGYELTAKGRLFLEKEGFGQFSGEMLQLFIPEGEAGEVHNPKGAGRGKSLIGDEVLLLAGSLKKGMLRNLLLAGVDVLLMTEVCGVFSDEGKVSGAMLAGKHGVYAVKCRHFVDTDDCLAFSRGLAGSDMPVREASFVLEVWKASAPVRKTVSVPASLGVTGNKITLHPGKHADHQVFLEFTFSAEGLDTDAIEHRSRQIAEKLGAAFPQLDASLAKAEITQFAWECEYILRDAALPPVRLKGHHLSGSRPVRSCQDILTIRKQAEGVASGLPADSSGRSWKQLHMAGGISEASEIRFSPLNEPGFAVPLMACTAAWDKLLPGKQAFQVVVAGGGTAGSMAVLGALEKGARAVVLDYFNELGGTKTMCGVMGYYHGHQKQVFFRRQDAEANQLATLAHMTKKLGRMQFLRDRVLEKEGAFMGRAVLCGAVMDDKTIRGVLVCRHGRLQVITGDVVIDATGDGDVAGFAGAAFDHGDSRAGKTQNYSQWDIRGAGPIPSNTNRDYDIIDNTKISEVQRGLFLSHYEAHFYDFHPMLAVRESRRIRGVYELNLLDAVEGTHFRDVLCLASSDFDPHYVGTTEYTRCGFLLPHSNDVTLEIPYRCIVPEKVDGLLISGRGFSQTHSALQFTRMTSDLIVLGYLTGQIAADISWKGARARDYDVSALQKEWETLGYYPDGLLRKKEGNALGDPEEVGRRVAGLAEGKPEFLYEVIKLPAEKALPVLKSGFAKATAPASRLLFAKALAWFGEKEGNALIAEELSLLCAEEAKQGYPKDFVDNYDLIREREKNFLEGRYWRINQDIALLALTGNREYTGLIAGILKNTTSGGPMMTRENDYFDGRIDLKLVPFHNRILNLCFYAERIPAPAFIQPFEQLLKDKYIGGYKTAAYEKVRWRVYGGDLELFIGAALARCGGRKGYDILTDYLSDIHYNFKAFAAAELATLTGGDFGYDQQKWSAHLASAAFPRSVAPINKMVEV